MKVAIVQVRGPIHMTKKLRDSLRFLKLPKKNSCVIVDSTDSYKGMIILLRDYITWGEINEDTLSLLLEKRGRLPGKKQLTEEYLKEKTGFGFREFSKEVIEGRKRVKDVPGLKPFFRLKPPVNGFERGGIKKQFSLGGALGYRKNKINDLITRMV